ncbi:MAG TPA: shikimate kinase [Acidimicrobiia bacterium]
MDFVDNLVLTGFMGTGKTSVGREVAHRLGMEFIDTDEIIESRHGPIDRIFTEHGEPTFRELERELAKELGQRKGLVIATGGGMMLDQANVEELTRNAHVFCLVASPEEIHRRLTHDEIRRERPLLEVDDPKRRITDLIAGRRDGYARFPQIETEHRDVAAIADEVVRRWLGSHTKHGRP